jgi:phospholipase/carboxylesterase
MATTIYTVERKPQEPSERPPLLLMLHGYGSNERDLISFAPYLDARLHIVAARGILNLGFGYAWYQLGGGPGNLRPDPATRTQALDVLGKFVADLPERLGADPQRFFLLGFSQGAIMSYALGLTQPQRFAGIIPLSGYFDSETVSALDVTQLDELDILAMHGTYDEVIPVTAARKTRDFLAQTPVTLSYHEYPVGHTVASEGLALIANWLAERVEA